MCRIARQGLLITACLLMTTSCSRTPQPDSAATVTVELGTLAEPGHSGRLSDEVAARESEVTTDSQVGQVTAQGAHPVTDHEMPAEPSAATETSTDLLSASIWIEGEEAHIRNHQPHGWYDSVKSDVLSGGEWISHFDENREGTVGYHFTVSQAGDYTFWLRANPIQASLSYRLNGGDWQPIDVERDQRGLTNIAVDNKPDLRFIAWLRVGRVPLQSGENTLEFRFHSRAQHHGAIDCFCLTATDWVPSGAARPDAVAGPAGPADWFPVVMDDDKFSPASVIDMSHLVEAPAGQYGFLQRDGRHLRFEQASEPIRLWGINAGPDRKTPEEMIQAARWFRKHGINVVRQHTVIEAVGLLDSSGEFDPERLDHYDRWFATLKEHGLYTTWSVIYPHHGAFLRQQDGIPADLFAELDRLDEHRDGRRGPIVVNDFINLDRSLQDVAWRYFAKLLEHVNPYTGLAYRDDPALACVEMQNESNVFFYTLNVLRDNRAPLLARQMRQRFHDFAVEKYGSRDAVLRAWGNRADIHDDWDRGELGLMGAHHWGADGPLYEFAGQPRRTGDYLEFLTDIQKNYFIRRETELRELGFRGVTVTTAWRSGGPAAEMANLYCDLAADMIDRHNYAGGGDGGHRIVEGRVELMTHLTQPGRGLLALGMFQVEDRPFAVSEWSMMPPSPWKVEAAPLYAFYGMGLQGWDASYHFACGGHRMGDGWPGQGKYVTETPHYLGQFPALALAVHQGHFREAPIIAERHLIQEEVFSGRDVLRQSLTGGGFDIKELEGDSITPPAALAIGRVTISFDDGETRLDDLSPYWNQADQQLVSSTGELFWDYGRGCIEARSANTQGVIGFAGGRSFDLPAVSVKIETPFVSLIFTALDDAELEFSRHILITGMARDRQTGSEFSEDGSELLVMGGPPLEMEPVQARIELRGGHPVEVRPLDFYGVPRPERLEVHSDGSFEIDGRYRTYYYEVVR